MSELSFSDEAIEAARKRAMDNDIGEVGDSVDWAETLDAALAHDAERLARQVIEQRVAALSGEEVKRFADGGSFWSHPNEWRAALLRALLGEHD